MGIFGVGFAFPLKGEFVPVAAAKAAAPGRKGYSGYGTPAN